ncbi:DUF6245 family protein [Streptosporangium sp. NPDC023615]|uniref:DUF6245 family protein n=1 Tax=Streptosporangium sp. NPDC023615 TaxID=3154794 RepID=UPI00342FD065
MAAGGLALGVMQQLLGVAGTGQVPDVETVAAHVAEIKAARERLVTAIGNVDILLQMLSGLSGLLDEN